MCFASLPPPTPTDPARVHARRKSSAAFTFVLQLMVPGQDGRVFFASSGAEANEAALKITRRTGRTHVVAIEQAFHGRTLGALSLTSKAAYREPFEPLPGDVTWVPYGDAEALRLISIDPHSPNEFRCNQIVRNIDEFYETFGVTETDALWMAPEERVTIW